MLFLHDQSRFEIIGGARREILGFHWVSSQVYDCVLLHTSGLDVYRLEEQRLRHIKYYKQPMSHYWVDGGSGIIVTASVQKPTELTVYFLSDNTGEILGPVFEPEHKDKDHLGWTTRQSTSTEVTGDQEQGKDDYTARLAVIYGRVVFVYLVFETGVVTLYHIKRWKVEKMECRLNTSPGVSELHCIDNILIVSNIPRQSSMLFDLHFSKSSESVCITSHSPGFHSLPIPQESSPDLLDMLITVPTFPSYFELSMSRVSVDQDVLIDAREGVAYMLGIRQEAVAQGIQEKGDAVSFLMRRKGCAELAVGFILEETQHLSPLTEISNLLSILVSHFRLENSSLQEVSYRCLFLPLWAATPPLPVDYIVAISLEYLRHLLDNDCDASTDFQFLLIIQLIAHDCMSTLHSLLHRCVFTTSQPIAVHLLSVGSQFVKSVGLDMLWRLGEVETIIQALWGEKRTYEAKICADSVSFLYVPQVDFNELS